MRNTIRVRKNRIPSTSAPQAQTRQPALVAKQLEPLLDLENAVDGASALLELLAEKVVDLRHELGCDPETGRGFGALAESNILQLRKTMAGMSAAFIKQTAPVPAQR